MVAIVHLVTLGWITSSILGALYVVSPMALRMPMPVRWPDYAAYALVTAGTVGMAGHFWMQAFGGVGWSAALVVLGIARVALRTLRGLRPAPIQRPVKLHIALAFFNLIGAAALGTLIGFDKRYQFLPDHGLSNVMAHAHLAALGWAVLMVMGVGYRLLPMLLPSAMPKGRSLYASAILLEAGTAGLFVSFLARSSWRPAFALMVAGAFAAFYGHVGWMRKRPRPAPAGLPRPDYGVAHAFQAMAYSGLTVLLGLYLVLAPESDRTFRAASVYGVLGLVGFLAQIVVGIEARVLPIFTSYHANLNGCGTGPVTRPHEMPLRPLQGVVFTLWTAGVPALAAGMFLGSAPLVATGGWILLLGVTFGGANAARVLAYAFHSRSAVGTMHRSRSGQRTA
jgi:hypothetical protein